MIVVRTQAQCTGAPVNCPPGQEEFTYQEVIPNDVIRVVVGRSGAAAAEPRAAAVGRASRAKLWHMP